MGASPTIPVTAAGSLDPAGSEVDEAGGDVAAVVAHPSARRRAEAAQ